jgi:Fe(3+) dicitrate transport protein
VAVESAPSGEPAAPAAEPAAPAKAVPAAAAGDAIEVTVVGTKLSRTAGSVHVLRSKDLERYNYDDPTRAVLSVPGVYVRGEDGFGLRPNIGIRGVNPDRSKKITLLEDGVLFGPAPYSAPAAYYFPIMTRMDKLRVIKGPGTISYGPQTVGGTLDMVTRDIPTGVAGAADVAAGQYGYGKAHVWGGASTERFGVLIEGVRLQSNGFKELPDNADTGFVRNEWMVKAGYTVDPRARVRNELKLKLTYSDEVSNETYLGLSDADLSDSPNLRYPSSALDRMTNHRTSIVLTHKLELPKHWSVTTNAYRHDFTRLWRRTDGLAGANIANVLRFPTGRNQHFYDVLRGTLDSSSPGETVVLARNDRDFVSGGIETRFLWEGVTGAVSHRLEIGGRYHHDRIDRRHNHDGYLMQEGELVPDGGATKVIDFNEDVTDAVALHALYALTWKGLTVTPGIRTEIVHSSHTDWLNGSSGKRTSATPLPGLSAYYAIVRDFGVLAGVYQGYSPPPPGTDNKPEKSFNYEGGARYTRGALRLESIAFYNDYKNMTSVCDDAGGCGANGGYAASLGQSRTYGFEAFGQHDLPAGPLKLPLLAAYTFSRGEFLHSFTSADPGITVANKGDTVPYVPRHQLRVSAGAEHTRAGGNASLTYVAKTREETESTSGSNAPLYMDQQIIVDLSAYAQIWKTIRVYLNVLNLLDSRYVASHRPFGARPNAPRWVQVGLKGSF